jgi:hypothetical protein
MSLARDIAIRLGAQLRGGVTVASTPLSNERLNASSLTRSKFAAAVATSIRKRLAHYSIVSLSLSSSDNDKLIVTCEIQPCQ